MQDWIRRHSFFIIIIIIIIITINNIIINIIFIIFITTIIIIVVVVDDDDDDDDDYWFSKKIGLGISCESFAGHWGKSIPELLMCLKTAAWSPNSKETDPTPFSVASDMGLQCLLTPTCPNTERKYAITILDSHIHSWLL